MKKMKLICMFAMLSVLGIQLHTQAVPLPEIEAKKSVDVKDAFARMVGVGKNGSVYMNITSKEGDKLVKASSDVSKKVELHTHIVNEDTGVARMVTVPSMDVKAGEVLALKPSGKHIMLIGLNREVKTSETFDLTLHFEKAGAVHIKVPVKPLGGSATGEKKCCCHK